MKGMGTLRLCVYKLDMPPAVSNNLPDDMDVKEIIKEVSEDVNNLK